MVGWRSESAPAAPVPSKAAAAYRRIGVSDADDDETALRKAEVFLVSREQSHRRMGSSMWEQAWAVNLDNPLPAIGDIGHVEPALEVLLGQRAASDEAEVRTDIHGIPASYVRADTLPNGTCLVPGCGKGYAVAAFARSGRRGVGIEIAPSAARAAQHLLQEQGLPRGSWSVTHGDFFEHEPTRLYDVVYDATFLCSLLPEQRENWAAKIASLLALDGELVTTIFPVADYVGGPPYAMSIDLLRSLLGPHGLQPTSLQRLPPSLCSRPHFRGAEVGDQRRRRPSMLLP